MLDAIRTTVRSGMRRAARAGGSYLVRLLPPEVVRKVGRSLPPLLKARLRNLIFATPSTPPSFERPLKDLVSRHLPAVAQFDAELSWLTAEQVGGLPVVRPRLTLNLHRLLFNLIRALGTRPRFVVLLNALTRGGADLYAVSIYKALAGEYGPNSVTFIVTDRREATSRDWLPSDARLIFLDDLQGALDLDSKRYLLYQMIAIVRPQAVFNVNSRVIWDYLARYGGMLGSFTSLYSGIFCYDYREDGAPGGYAAFNLRDALAFHTGIVLDSETFRQQLITDLSLPPSLQARLHTLHTPLQELELTPPEITDRTTSKVVLWAGRFAFQKLPLLAIEVARMCPEYEFHFHGEGDAHISEAMHAGAPANVRFFGRFKSMESLLREGYELLLYTSVTDGVPTVIQGAARFGVTVVATAAGGIPELVRADTGWLVADTKDPAAYAEAIREAMGNPAERQKRALNMRELVHHQHAPERFAAMLKALVEETSNDPL